MALKDYTWDAEAAHKIEEQTLDKHYTKNQKHYDGLAKEALQSLKKISPHPTDLKQADLTAILRPMIDRDSVTLKGMEERKLPEPNGQARPAAVLVVHAIRGRAELETRQMKESR
jgi:hypothetical protein